MREMSKSRKGQVFFLGIMIAIMGIITLIILIEPMKIMLNDARDSNSLDCTNTSISVGQIGACILTDWYMFYFLGAGLAVAISWISIRKISEFV